MLQSPSFEVSASARRPARSFGRALAGLTLALTAGWLVQLPAPAHALLPPGAGLPQDAQAAQADPGTGEIVLATWSAGTCSSGQGWCLENAQAEIPMPNERVAKRTAKKFNRIESKAEKSDGFMPTESGPCSDPLSGVQC